MRSYFSVDEEGSGDEEGGVRSHDGADDEREDEPADALCAEEEQREEHDQGARSCVDGPGHGLPEAAFGDGGEILLAGGVEEEVVADAVEHHDGVVHRIADDAQERGDEEKVHFKCGEASDDGENSQRDQRVVERGDDGAECECPRAEAARDFSESEGEVEDDGSGGDGDGPEGADAETSSDHRPDGGELEFGAWSQLFIDMLSDGAVLLVPERAGSDEDAPVSRLGQGDVPQRLSFEHQSGQRAREVVFGLPFRELDFHEGSPGELHAQARAGIEEDDGGAGGQGQRAGEEEARGSDERHSAPEASGSFPSALGHLGKLHFRHSGSCTSLASAE